MIITAIKQQVRRAGRYSIYIDGRYAFSLSEAGLLGSGLASGQEVSAERLAALRAAAADDKAYGRALHFVALRPRSEWEVMAYLRRKDVAGETAQAIVGRLRDTGLLDDAVFARQWVENRRLLKAVSYRRLKQELQQKHVPGEVINAALAADETTDRQTLRELVARKRRQSRYQDDAKLMAYLARQGFGYEDIRAVMAESE